MNPDRAAAALRAASSLPPRGLPLTAFEEQMLADDRPTHPMVIPLRLDFAGGPPPATLAAAFSATLCDEPLLTARVERRWLGRPRWVPGEQPRLLVSSRLDADADAWIGASPRIDPYRGPVLHAEVVTRPDGWTLLIAVHHAAADGLGIVGFVERWLEAAAGHEASQRRQAHGGAVAKRGRVAGSWRAFVRMLPGLWVGIQGVRQFVARRVVSVGRPAGEAAESSFGAWQPAVVTATLSEAEVIALEQRARAGGVTANDLLVAAYVAALGDAYARLPAAAADAAGDAWIRIGVPMSLRTKSDYALPAANRVSMVFLDRRPADRHDHEALVRGIRAEMDVIRSHELGHIFPLTLEISRLLPGGLRRVAQRPAPQCTAVLSNLGRCFRRTPLAEPAARPAIAGSRLTVWWIVPPVRPGTAVAAATHETDGRRTIAMQFDPTQLSAADARQLLDAACAALHRAREGVPMPQEPAYAARRGQDGEAQAASE